MLLVFSGHGLGLQATPPGPWRLATGLLQLSRGLLHQYKPPFWPSLGSSSLPTAPSWKCRDTPQIQSQPTIFSSSLHPPHQRIKIFSPTFTGGVAPWSLSPFGPELWLPFSMTSGTMPASSRSTAYTDGGPWWLTGRVWTRWTSNGRECGPATPSGNTSHHHVLPPCP